MTSCVNTPLFFPVFLFCFGNYLASGNEFSALRSQRINSLLPSSNWTNITVSECHILKGKIEDSLGQMFLEVYTFRNNYSRVVLPKLSFIRPTWTRMDTMLYALNKSVCHSVIKNTSSVEFPYFGKVDDFDVVTLEVNVTDGLLVEWRKYQFFLPFFARRNLSNIEQWKVFLYMDVSSRRRAILFWERAPAVLNITKYQLNVSCGNDHDIIIFDGVFSFEVPSRNFVACSDMTCRFYIRPWLPSLAKWGYISSTPAVNIKRRELLLLAVFVLCFVLTISAILLFQVHKMFKSQYRLKSLTGSAMLIYEAKTEEQFKFVGLLAQTLEEDHSIKIYFDHRDVPLTETKDPLKWFVETLSISECFIFLQLPAPENVACIPPGVYSLQKIVSSNFFRLFRDSPRFISVELDSCPYEETWVSSRLSIGCKYILPKDFCILVGKRCPFSSILGCRKILRCIQEIKESKKEKDSQHEAYVLEHTRSYFHRDEESDSGEQEDREFVASGRRSLLQSFNLGGVKNESDSE